MPVYVTVIANNRDRAVMPAESFHIAEAQRAYGLPPIQAVIIYRDRGEAVLSGLTGGNAASAPVQFVRQALGNARHKAELNAANDSAAVITAHPPLSFEEMTGEIARDPIHADAAQLRHIALIATSANAESIYRGTGYRGRIRQGEVYTVAAESWGALSRGQSTIILSPAQYGPLASNATQVSVGSGSYAGGTLGGAALGGAEVATASGLQPPAPAGARGFIPPPAPEPRDTPQRVERETVEQRVEERRFDQPRTAEERIPDRAPERVIEPQRPLTQPVVVEREETRAASAAAPVAAATATAAVLTYPEARSAVIRGQTIEGITVPGAAIPGVTVAGAAIPAAVIPGTVDRVFVRPETASVLAAERAAPFVAEVPGAALPLTRGEIAARRQDLAAERNRLTEDRIRTDAVRQEAAQIREPAISGRRPAEDVRQETRPRSFAAQIGGEQARIETPRPPAPRPPERPVVHRANVSLDVADVSHRPMPEIISHSGIDHIMPVAVAYPALSVEPLKITRQELSALLRVTHWDARQWQQRLSREISDRQLPVRVPTAREMQYALKGDMKLPAPVVHVIQEVVRQHQVAANEDHAPPRRRFFGRGFWRGGRDKK